MKGNCTCMKKELQHSNVSATSILTRYHILIAYNNAFVFAYFAAQMQCNSYLPNRFVCSTQYTQQASSII